ncbi:MAG: hypothetical protein PHF74_08175 [Dehalococcoidales bacterium]|nr:hypothetical protein [Dehalococcoidales bacterium]
MKKIMLLVLAVLFLVSFKAVAQENKFVEEFKNWKWSLGGMAYLVNADDFYYSAGIKRDLGPLFNWLPDERLYGELGYLNSAMIGNAAEDEVREYGYIGLSTNANFLVQCGVSGVNKMLNSNFQTPEILNKILATIGIVGAKRFDETLWDINRGYDFGCNLAIIKEW